MDPNKKYYTMGEYVMECEPSKVNLGVEEADVIRSAALEIAKEKEINIRFKRQDSGMRAGISVTALPKQVWDEAFKNQK